MGMEKIVDRVRYLCKGSGITVARLEKKLGFAHGSIYKSGSGMQYQRVKAIADYFGMPAEWIYSGDVEALEAYELVQAYRNAPDGRKEAVRCLLGVVSDLYCLGGLEMYEPVWMEGKTEAADEEDEEEADEGEETVTKESDGNIGTDGRERVEEDGLF